jgi:uncharacterized protein (DUF1778 family)
MTKTHKSSKYRVAAQTLFDQRRFMANCKKYQALLNVLDRPARCNAGLKDLFSRQTPWQQVVTAKQI